MADKDKDKDKECKACEGDGYIYVYDARTAKQVTCKVCGGRGQ